MSEIQLIKTKLTRALHYIPMKPDDWRRIANHLLGTMMYAELAVKLDISLSELEARLKPNRQRDRELYARGLLKCVMLNPEFTLNQIASVLDVDPGWLAVELDFARTL